MKINMQHEDFYFGDGYEYLSAKGIVEGLESAAEILHAYPDDSWIDEEMGECDCGPYGGYWYAKWSDVEKGFFCILRRSDFSREAEYYDTLTDLEAAWEEIHMDALDTARDNVDLGYFDMATAEYAETKAEYMARRKIVVAEGDSEKLGLLNPLITLLRRFNPTGYEQWEYGSPFGIVPSHAREDEEAEWWTTEAPTVLEQLKEALTECAAVGDIFFDLRDGYWGFHF